MFFGARANKSQEAGFGGRIGKAGHQFGGRIGKSSALIHASYETAKDKVGGFTLDKRFSTDDTRVYHNKKGVPTIVHRGTANGADWKDNALVAIGLGHLGGRHKRARAITEAVEKAYKRPANAIGHSLGGRLAETSGARGNITTYNKAAGLGDLFKTTDKKQLDVRTGRDLVSALSVTQKGGARSTIPQESRGVTHVGDLLNAHKLTNLSAAANAMRS